MDGKHDLKGASREELLEVIGRLEAVIAGQQAVIDQLQRRITALEGGLKGKGRLGMPGNKPGARPGPTERKGSRKPRLHGFARRRMAPAQRGVSNLFMLFAPLEGWRRVEVTDRRTKVDWAQVVKQLVDEDYPDKDRIALVMDNLNTHHPSSLYEAFEPAEARRIAERLEIHYTPKHGSWLDMAEIEIGVMSRQCLDRRIPDQRTLRREAAAWQDRRNQEAIKVDWRFTTADARIKLKSLYPSIQN